MSEEPNVFNYKIPVCPKDSVDSRDFLIDDDNLHEMTTLYKKKFNSLPVNIRVVENLSKQQSMPKIDFQNNNDEFIPMSISNDSKVLIKDFNLNISEKDFESVKAWVIKNEKALIQLWNTEIDAFDFIEGIKF